MAKSAHTKVPSTSKISIEANKLFFKPNWIGVKER
jgi:hypothetical protein